MKRVLLTGAAGNLGGKLRRHLKKWDEYVDLECYGVLRGEFDASSFSA